MNKFKVGDIVTISKDSRHYGINSSNPKNVPGRVIVVYTPDSETSYAYRVEWAVRGNPTNTYRVHDLVFHDDAGMVTIRRKDIVTVMGMMNVCGEWQTKLAACFPNPFDETATVTVDFIRTCYNSASNSRVKAFIVKRYPKLFKEQSKYASAISLVGSNPDDGVFDDKPFGTLGCAGNILIVQGLAGEQGIPVELRGRSLYVPKEYKINILETTKGSNLIYFTTKK